MQTEEVYEEEIEFPATTDDALPRDRTPRAAPRRGSRRTAPARSKSVDDSGALAAMRASRTTNSSVSSSCRQEGDSSSSDAANGEDAGDRTPARPSRRGGRRAAPARTKSADDMAAMDRMTTYARQKSTELVGGKPKEVCKQASNE